MIRISRAGLQDVKAILKLENNVWKENVTSIWDEAMAVRYGMVLKATHGKQIVGALIALRTWHGEDYICDLVVNPCFREHGIAHRLKKELERRIGKGRILTAVKPTNLAMLKINHDLGYRKIRTIRNFHRDGKPHILMEKRV